MNRARIHQLAEFVGNLQPAQLVGTAPVVLQRPRTYVNRLDADEAASPVGWLPAVAPADWCWLQQGEECLPVYKSSCLWQEPTPMLVPMVRRVSLRYVAQAAEWLEISDSAALLYALGIGAATLTPAEARRRLVGLLQ
jgi:hypothetical protein